MSVASLVQIVNEQRMYLNDPGSPDRSDFRRRVSHRLAKLSKICDDPIGSSTTVSTCVPEDSEQLSPVSSPQSTSASFPRRDSQPMSSPSSISRNMSDPSLSMSWESPLRLLDPLSLREARGRIPPRRKSSLLQSLESSGSARQEEKCRAAAASPESDRNHKTAKLSPACRAAVAVAHGTASDPSLSVSLESSLGLVDPLSPRVALRTRTPTRSKSWLLHDSELAGSASAEEKCRTAVAILERDRKTQAAKLGAADPYVECMREQAKELRRRADNLKWNKLVSWHEDNVHGAMRAVDDGADLEELEVALRQARDSALGPGHWIVRKGKQHLLQSRKLLQLEQLANVTEEQESRLAEAILIGDIHILAAAIDEAASTIGSSHRSVEAARDALKEQRRELQRSSWCTLVEEHRVLMLQACATNDIDQINARIWETANSELGVGHPILEHGKTCIRDLKRLGQRAQLDFYRRECVLMLNAPEIAEALAVS